MYYLKPLDNQEIMKVKGLNKLNDINVKDFDQLLFKDVKIEKNQSKWFKSINKGDIEIKEQLYTLQQTENKITLIYDKNNKLIETKDYQIVNNDYYELIPL